MPANSPEHPTAAGIAAPAADLRRNRLCNTANYSRGLRCPKRLTPIDRTPAREDTPSPARTTQYLHHKHFQKHRAPSPSGGLDLKIARIRSANSTPVGLHPPEGIVMNRRSRDSSPSNSTRRRALS